MYDLIRRAMIVGFAEKAHRAKFDAELVRFRDLVTKAGIATEVK